MKSKIATYVAIFFGTCLYICVAAMDTTSCRATYVAILYTFKTSCFFLILMLYYKYD